jgi:hypothetical protein
VAELETLAPKIDIAGLDLDDVAALSRLLLDHFPIAEDLFNRNRFEGDVQEPRRTRDQVRQRLVAADATDTLERLAADRAPADVTALRREIRRAHAKAADRAVEAMTPAQLLARLDVLAGNANTQA